MHKVKFQYWSPLINTAEHGVNAIIGLLCHADVGDVADVSEIHAASIFRVRVCTHIILFWKTIMVGLGYTHVHTRARTHTHREREKLTNITHFLPDNKRNKSIPPKCLHHCQHPQGVTTKELT
jgi:hypothetical protein